jgi:predicted glycosyltransferase
VTQARSDRRLVVFIHAQHLTGVGHYVRSYEIARALSAGHEVLLLDGGRPVPRAADGGRITHVELPRIVRGSSGLACLDAGGDIGAVLHRRRELLADRIAAVHPDVLIVEHYPFSKWALEEEILAAIDAVRGRNPRALVLCSIRDVVLQTVQEPVSGAQWCDRILAVLDRYFDAVLVHGDPELLGIGDSFPAAARIPIPVLHTGIVSEKPATAADPDGETVPGRLRPYVLISTGGGAGIDGFVELCFAAWERLSGSGAAGSRRLVVFGGTAWSAGRRRRVEETALRVGAVLHEFTPHFLQWMAAADLTVTHAGYNTCANILETGARALLLPDPAMSDQALRAAVFGKRGLATTLRWEGLTAERLAEAMATALQSPSPAHAIALNGAARTCTLIEELVRVD